MNCPRSFSLIFHGVWCALFLFIRIPVSGQLPPASGDQRQALLNEPLDVSEDFRNFANTYFLAEEVVSYDPATGQGTLRWQRGVYKTRQAFNNMLAFVKPVEGNEFPEGEYEVNPVLPFSVGVCFTPDHPFASENGNGNGARPGIPDAGQRICPPR